MRVSEVHWAWSSTLSQGFGHDVHLRLYLEFLVIVISSTARLKSVFSLLLKFELAKVGQADKHSISVSALTILQAIYVAIDLNGQPICEVQQPVGLYGRDVAICCHTIILEHRVPKILPKGPG